LAGLKLSKIGRKKNFTPGKSDVYRIQFMSYQIGVILVAFVKQYLDHKQIPGGKLSGIITGAWGKISDIFTCA